MVKLSKRMMHLADMVTQGATVADVGTDHGYIPIYLIQSERIRHAFALDIREGPLLRAKEHIAAFGLDDYITVRRSDGVAALKAGEADSILIAGMGGDVMLHILVEGESVIASAKELILQPQSEIGQVRKYLCNRGYQIDREDMVLEEGKYYPMMHVVLWQKEDIRAKYAAYEAQERELFFRYGERLLKEKNSVLQLYLRQQIGQYEAILNSLAAKSQTEALVLRREEILHKLACAKRAAAYQKEE